MDDHISHHFRRRVAKGEIYDRISASRIRLRPFYPLLLKEQVAATANRYYSGQTGLILLKIDSSLLTAAIKVENLVGGTELFPHIYGSLPISAVIGTAPLISTPPVGFLFPNGF